jgi:hypothetical protein
MTVARRLLFSLLIAASLGACADPPGTPKPLPVNYAEENKSAVTYGKYSPLIREVPGVMSTYLTANNNPRTLVVVVPDNATANAVTAKFGTAVDGLPLDVQIQRKDDFDRDPGELQQVPKAEMPTTWWGKVMFFLTNWRQMWEKGLKG